MGAMGLSSFSAIGRRAAPVNRAMYDACLELGVREAPDHNALDAHAGVVGPMPHNRYKEVRLGTLVTYVRAARGRPNLTIYAGRHVDRIVLEGDRAKGVTYLDAAKERRTAFADEIVISAGVHNSPAILHRSGIGPAEWLRPLGIDVVADLPVGRNLTDHPGFPMLFRAQGLGVTTGRFFAANVRGPANARGEPEWQTHPFPVDEEEHTAGFWTYLTRQEATGEVRIQSADPTRPATHRPPLQYQPTRSGSVRRRSFLCQSHARLADLPIAQRRLDRRS